MGYHIYPFTKHPKRQLIQSTPKFYLFDVGVAGYLSKRTVNVLKGAEAGRALEHYILMELKAYQGYHRLNSEIQYWRSKQGHKVDFVLSMGQIAIEVKISESPRLTDLKGLVTYCRDYSPKRAIVVCKA